MLYRRSQSIICILSAGVFLLLGQATAFCKTGFVVKPPAPWVKPLTPALKQTIEGSAAETGSSQILYDRQINVGDRGVERFYHSVNKVETPAGLDDLSQLRIYFEPSYQTLTIHFVRLQRGTQTIDALRPGEVKLIQQEDELDQQLFNGSQQAVIFLNDLRVGDTIEFAYTITGENPVLAGRYADSFYLAGQHPIRELALRLLWPAKRALAIKSQNTEAQPTQQSIGANTEYLWYRTNVPAIIEDDETPDSFDPYPSVSLSEFATWKAVVDWALPMYRPTRLTAPELQGKIEQWRKSSDSPEQQVTAALRFVQDEVRYLGIELGRYSHQPTLPDKTFARRFGDCKDKSLLLSSILTTLGIESWPALVNSRLGESLDSWQPTPFAFDHVIVCAKIKGKTYWLDPTTSYQRGSLAMYYDPPFARALVLRENNDSLEHIPVPASDSGATDVLEVYRNDVGSRTISLNVTTVYTGSDADSMRYDLSTQSLAELSKDYLNFYADTTPSIRADGLPVVDDDPLNNRLVIKERYL
ncbi:MAG TPA: DUF3857 domain-containing protein, partial [Pyrinomonadaceae bacterium]|nr:DUF3857 domain-containing protein [Pyrinomonadaceae bacterium]